MTIRERVAELLNQWRMLSSSQIRSLLSQADGINRDSLHVILTRMRKSGEILTLGVPRYSLNFHPRWKKRYALLKALNGKERAQAFSTSGLYHHTQLADLYLSWTQQFPDLQVDPNVSTQKVTATQSIGRSSQSPDLSIRLDSNFEVYIEYERSLKSSDRYRTKWGAYENNPSVVSCLYWLEDPHHRPCLTRLAKSFFGRSYTPKSFSLGFVNSNEFRDQGFGCKIELLSVGKTEIISLREYMRIVSVPVSDLLSREKFSPPTTCKNRAISALRADSSPPTISNEWVCKQTGERSRLGVLPKLK